MIAFNFDYWVPSSIDEAVKLFEELKSKDSKPIYYGGGTEIITFARKNDIYTKAVIDLKGIKECNALYIKEDKIIIGSTVTLTALKEANFFPLINEVSTFPADHTSRNKITLGGNICGKIIFKEAVLVPLVADADVVIAGKDGERIVPINSIFKEKLQLQEGEFLVQIIIDKKYATLPYYVIKHTRFSKIGYPLLSMAAVKKDNRIQLALSGVCGFPFRSYEMEKILNDDSMSYARRVEEALKHLPAPMVSNIQGGSEYREFILKSNLLKSLELLETKRLIIF